jgi:tRNA nucleotidyltransferase/poly(A) polymerase
MGGLFWYTWFMFALSYARHVPAHARIGRFVADEPRLNVAFKLLKDHPDADVLVTGGTARDAVLGRVPKGIHLTVQGIPEAELADWCNRRNVPRDLDIKIPASGIWHPATRTLKHTPHHTLPLVHDLARRDATVNAMAYSVRDGVLHDPFDGLRDIEEKKLRTIGDPEQRFHEDPVRILRFLRLAGHLEFSIEDHALHAMRKIGKSLNRLVNDENGRAKYHIPRHHLGREFISSLSHNAGKSLSHFFHAGVMEHLVPEIHKLESLVTRKGVSGRDHAETILTDLHEHGASSAVTLAALLAILEDESATAFQKTTERLHLPLLENGINFVHSVESLLKHRNVLVDQDPAELSHAEFEHIFGGKRGDDLLLFLHALSVAGGHDSIIRERWYTAKRRKEEMTGTELPELVRGRDLLSLGFVPGHHLREIMRKIRNEQLAGKIATKADALEFARSMN